MACFTMCCGLDAVCVVVVQRDCDIPGIVLGCKTSQPGTATGLRHDASLVRVLHADQRCKQKRKTRVKILSQNGNLELHHTCGA